METWSFILVDALNPGTHKLYTISVKKQTGEGVHGHFHHKQQLQTQPTWGMTASLDLSTSVGNIDMSTPSSLTEPSKGYILKSARRSDVLPDPVRPTTPICKKQTAGKLLSLSVVKRNTEHTFQFYSTHHVLKTVPGTREQGEA